MSFQADRNGLRLHDGEDWQHGSACSSDPGRGEPDWNQNQNQNLLVHFIAKQQLVCMDKEVFIQLRYNWSN